MDLLFEEPGSQRPWATIGIGDGGNEIGMGVLPREIVERDIPNGHLIAARTGADFLLVGGVANWGAYGLLAAVAVLRTDLAGTLMQHFTGELEEAILRFTVDLGQVIDDSRVDRLSQLKMTIDRLPLETRTASITEIRVLAA